MSSEPVLSSEACPAPATVANSGPCRSEEEWPQGVGVRFWAVYGALFIPFGILTPYLQVVLKEQGLDRPAIGLVQGMLEITGVLAPPLWGLLSDQLRRPREVLAAAILCGMPAFLLFGQVQTLLGAVGAALLFGIFFRPLIPLTDGLTFRYIHNHGGNYGTARTGGSVSFVLTLLILEWIGVGHSATSTILNAFVVASILHALSIALVPRPDPQAYCPADERRPTDWTVFLSRTFVAFTLAAFLGRLAMMSYYHFFTLYLKERIGLPEAGLIWLLGSAAEIPVIYFSGSILRRVGVRSLFALGLAGVVVRLAGYSLVTSIGAVAALQLLHALTFGAYHCASVTFIHRLVPPESKATAQTLFYGLTMGLGGLCGGALSGILAGRYGFPTLYASCAGLALLGLLILYRFVPPLVGEAPVRVSTEKE